MWSSLREPTPRERKRDLTRARLFEEALAEFRSVGFDRASISRIAQRAGVSRPSFYFHFPTKEHVLLELQWNLELGIVERLKSCDSLRDTLHEFVEGMIDAEESAGGSDLFGDMLRLYVRRPEGLPLDDQPFPLVVELSHRFAAGAKNGELRAGLEPARATDLFLTSVFGFLTGTAGSPESRRADLRTLIALYLGDGA